MLDIVTNLLESSSLIDEHDFQSLDLRVVSSFFRALSQDTPSNLGRPNYQNSKILLMNKTSNLLISESFPLSPLFVGLFCKTHLVIYRDQSIRVSRSYS